jgi:hypothetical protein
MAKKNVWNDPDNVWKVSQDLEKLRAAYLRKQRNKQLSELRAKRVIKRSVLDPLRDKSGKFW